MSYRLGIGSQTRKKRLELLEAGQAMLVWNLTHGSGFRPRRLSFHRKSTDQVRARARNSSKGAITNE